jgi:Tol biopolymer transport system component
MDSTMEEGEALRLSHNPGGTAETLRTHLASSYLAVDSTGKKIAFLLRDQGARPAVMDLLGRGVQLFNVELPLSSIGTFESIYHAAWSPRGNEVAFYNDSGFYLLDTVSGQACQVALGLAGLGERGLRWAYLAKWSPNGRYLAMITTSGRFPLEFSELTILNTVTGDLRAVQPERHLPSGKYYVLDIDWAPDNTTIAARVAVTMKEGVVYDGLYLMSARGVRQERQLPELTFTGASAGLSLSWSPDGKYLALNCPTSNEGRLCQIAVTK